MRHLRICHDKSREKKTETVRKRKQTNWPDAHTFAICVEWHRYSFNWECICMFIYRLDTDTYKSIREMKLSLGLRDRPEKKNSSIYEFTFVSQWARNVEKLKRENFYVFRNVWLPWHGAQWEFSFNGAEKGFRGSKNAKSEKSREERERIHPISDPQVDS